MKSDMRAYFSNRLIRCVQGDMVEYMDTPHLSIIVPVLNEQAIIGRTVDHLLAAGKDVPAEIIIVDGDPTGSTIREIRLQYGKDQETVKTIVGPKGRGPQMNAGASAAAGRVLLFVHADTRLPERGCQLVLDTLRRPDIAAGAFSLGIENGRRIYRLIETWANIRSAVLKIPYGDQAIFIKKRVFEDIGGYAGIPLMEDIDIMRRLKKGGFKTALIREAVYTSARRWENQGVIYGIIRNNLLSWLFYAGVNPSVLKQFYR